MLQEIQLEGESVYIDSDAGTFYIVESSWLVSTQFFSQVESDIPDYVKYECSRQIPRSCIESAEYVIQEINGCTQAWTEEGQTREPNVIAEFGNGSIDISTSENVQDELTGKTNYDFDVDPDTGEELLPGVGEGLIIGNSSDQDLDPYNMHLGAIVARHRALNVCIISDVSEDGEVILIDPWRIICLQSVQEFKGADYRAPEYVMGKLSARV